MTLKEILALRKARGGAATEPLPTIEPTIPVEETDLKVLLALYECSSMMHTYIAEWEGFKLLHQWLSPIRIPVEDDYLLTNLVGSYGVNETAKIVGAHPQVVLDISIDIYLERRNLIRNNLIKVKDVIS